jgi:alcohol dehydrogenase (quinone), cytochrome c subunit
MSRSIGLLSARLLFTILAMMPWGARHAQSEAQASSYPNSALRSDSVLARGQYLAAIGNCVSCHTVAGAAQLAGGVPFETPFGVIYSTNITPDSNTGIGSWSAADFRRAMHEGIAADGSHLFPAFPYTAFTKVSDEDVDAIYAYLRSVPAVKYTPPTNGLLFRIRWPMAIWNALFFEPGRYRPNAARDDQWNRGAYLTEGLGHCSACHTPRNALMAEMKERKYAGGTIQEVVAADKVRRWSAVNLTQAKHGLAAWSVADLDKYLRTGFSPRAGTFGPMNDVIVSSLVHLIPQDSKAMAVYLKSLPALPYEGPTPSPEQVTAGKGIYDDRCEKCHGRSGRGGIFSGPPLAGSAIAQSEDPASLINVLIYGPDMPKSVKFGAWETMPAYGEKLTDEQIAAVSNFIRGSWGNAAPPVTVEQVAEQR